MTKHQYDDHYYRTHRETMLYGLRLNNPLMAIITVLHLVDEDRPVFSCLLYILIGLPLAKPVRSILRLPATLLQRL